MKGCREAEHPKPSLELLNLGSVDPAMVSQIVRMRVCTRVCTRFRGAGPRLSSASL